MSFKYKGHLTWEEVVRIETLLNQGLNPAEIAVVIGRNKSVVYRCVNNNSVDGDFVAEEAWQLMHERKRTANHHPRIIDESLLENFVIEKLLTILQSKLLGYGLKSATKLYLIKPYIHGYKPKDLI